MIALNLKADNFFGFNDFDINFTYPKKVVNSTIENEYLSYCPTFRYKSFVMIMGPNASGKTTLGKLLRGIVNFINFKEYSHIISCIYNNKKDATFCFDFIDEDRNFYRLETSIGKSADGLYASKDINVCVRKTEIKNNDTYEKCVKRIEKMDNTKDSDYIKELEKINRMSWSFRLLDYNKSNGNSKLKDKQYLNVLDKTLKVLDPRIIEVKKLNTKDTYAIVFENRTVLINNGDIVADGNSANNSISSGTKDGIDIAFLVSSIKSNFYKFYYCDEKFSHVHTDVEKAFISLMIDCLHKDNQLIMTSHNTEVLEMNLPKHSFAFIKRDNENNVKCIYASDYIKKNTDSLKCAVDNDVFGTSPKVEEVYRLKEI